MLVMRRGLPNYRGSVRLKGNRYRARPWYQVKPEGRTIQIDNCSKTSSIIFVRPVTYLNLDVISFTPILEDMTWT